MEQYSINTVSKRMNIPKDTLRYYDKLKILSPKRGENKYRYYTDKDLVSLKYIQVMKYVGFTLSEIETIMLHRNITSEKCKANAIALLEEKKMETIEKVERLNKITDFFNKTIGLMSEGSIPEENDDIIAEIFHCLNGNDVINE